MVNPRHKASYEGANSLMLFEENQEEMELSSKICTYD